MPKVSHDANDTSQAVTETGNVLPAFTSSLCNTTSRLWDRTQEARAVLQGPWIALATSSSCWQVAQGKTEKGACEELAR